MVYKLKVQDPFYVNAPVALLHFGMRSSFLPPKKGSVQCTRLGLCDPPAPPSPKNERDCTAGTGGEGCCHFKMPADWSVNMDKIGADLCVWVSEWASVCVCVCVWERVCVRAHVCEILTSGPVVKIRKSKQRFTPIYTPFIYFLQKYTEKIIKRFHLSSLFVF